MTKHLCPPCPYCRSHKTFRHGFARPKYGKVTQRYWCNECDRTFQVK
ncbi:MAG: hypothetical protein RMX63_34605 [Aulosira sp. ZfuCHP01]|nr:hypothetical protein [Aulosira sp. ZfuVER01]MDZ8002334.1 hypothetical protein [Aulosira sp. DedVER01a]MDZ8056558.1 hypothetical protein [Aulosira sp. ZfuCHP01]